jgi:clan AA aspartic protease (TIGR02281 family)
MVPRRVWWALGFSAYVAASAAGALRAADASPEDVLKNHNLKRVGESFVLAAEADVLKKVNQAKLLSYQLSLALRQQAAYDVGSQNQQAIIQELRQQRIGLNEQIAALDQQINNLSATDGGNFLTNAQRNQLVTQRNQVALTYNGIIDRINLLQEQAPDSNVGNEIRAEVPRRREAYAEAVLNLRQLVDSTTKSYAELAQNADVQKAIDALGRATKAKPKLGPSRQFQDNVKLLERIEKSVITDAVELRRTNGGVYEVDVTFNGKVTKPMIFDTGAALTMISARLAAEIGLKPSPSDPEIRCETADGTVVIAKQKNIPSMRVGRFTVKNVVCAIMPANKGNVDPLLGQSFHRHFTYKMTPGSGHLVMSQVESLEQPQAKTGGRPPRNTSKAKRTTKPNSSPGKTPANSRPDADSSQ